MIRRLGCWLFGHKWRILPAWITGKPDTMRNCRRCRLVQKKLFGSSGAAHVKPSSWSTVGRQPF